MAHKPMKNAITDTFRAMLAGEMNDDEIEASLLAINERGITQEDLIGAATVMRQNMTPFDTPDDCIDVCGTGGDGLHTYNISTTSAIVVASCGVKVAKHGNRSVSSKSGSTDVLGALGIGLSAKPETLQHCLDSSNICFLAAPLFHPAMRHVSDARKQLKTRTIFNLLGPLCNPASVKAQVVGVYGASRIEPMIHALKALGSQSAIVVHSADGLDEFSVSDGSAYAELRYGIINNAIITPEQLGITRHNIDDLVGGDAAHNAAALKELLGGKQGAYRDAVLINAAAALSVANQADDIESGLMLAAEAIDSGRALRTLNMLVKVSHDG